MGMSLEQLARANDISMWAAANGLANLIERGLVEPDVGSRQDAVLELREIAELHRPGKA